LTSPTSVYYANSTVCLPRSLRARNRLERDFPRAGGLDRRCLELLSSENAGDRKM